MRRLRWLVIAIAFTAVLAGVLAGRVRVTADDPKEHNGITIAEYSAKFMCGEFLPDPNNKELPVKPGDYATSINVHNPNFTQVGFVKKAVIDFALVENQPKTQPPFVGQREQEGTPGNFFSTGLHKDGAMQIDCEDIRNFLAPPLPSGQTTPSAPTFIEGWVVIATDAHTQLDVRGIYTAHTFTQDLQGIPPENEGFSLDTQEYQRKLVQLNGPQGCNTLATCTGATPVQR